MSDSTQGDTLLPRMKDGTAYSGNQQYQGVGVMRWCAICGVHRTLLGGTIQFVLGGRHWVCVKHPKKVTK